MHGGRTVRPLALRMVGGVMAREQRQAKTCTAPWPSLCEGRAILNKFAKRFFLWGLCLGQALAAPILYNVAQ